MSIFIDLILHYKNLNIKKKLTTVDELIKHYYMINYIHSHLHFTLIILIY
jgi:hypothetical protein